MSEWSHLPNAAHIDRVIQSIKSHPGSWSAARDVAWGAAYDAAWSAAREAAWDAARDAVWNAARDAAWVVAAAAAWVVAAAAVRAAALDEVRDAARSAWDAILALITYDDAAKYLDMSSDQLKMWAILSEDPAAVLLLSAVIAYEKISELELA